MTAKPRDRGPLESFEQFIRKICKMRMANTDYLTARIGIEDLVHTAASPGPSSTPAKFAA
jgi:hypothetical protein